MGCAQSPRHAAPASQRRPRDGLGLIGGTHMTTSTGTREQGRVREGLATAIGRVPDTARATAAGARGTTSALEQIPDSTLRWLTASSIGLAAGLQVAGAPRWMQAARVGLALSLGAAIAL